MTPLSPVATAQAVLDLAEAGGFGEIRDLFVEGLRPMVTLTGLQFAPAGVADPAARWQPPAYANPATFDDLNVTLGSGPLAVPGTLSLPRTPGPLPAVVLLGGSGPTDRDGTVGNNKPLKDLAWGLASRGIVILRFDKVTFVHPNEVKADRDFTVADEYLPHALLQGGRDYQATVADDLSRWQAGLEQWQDITIRVYPPDNHFFFPGTGPSSPAELAPGQHLDAAVVADADSWLSTRAGSRSPAQSQE
jgi:hypothetical protein